MSRKLSFVSASLSDNGWSTIPRNRLNYARTKTKILSRILVKIVESWTPYRKTINHFRLKRSYANQHIKVHHPKSVEWHSYCGLSKSKSVKFFSILRKKRTLILDHIIYAKCMNNSWWQYHLQIRFQHASWDQGVVWRAIWVILKSFLPSKQSMKSSIS